MTAEPSSILFRRIHHFCQGAAGSVAANPVKRPGDVIPNQGLEVVSEGSGESGDERWISGAGVEVAEGDGNVPQVTAAFGAAQGGMFVFSIEGSGVEGKFDKRVEAGWGGDARR
jgi:hypothetical protein